MRLLITRSVLLIALVPVAGLAAQSTPLPAGTAEPQENAGAANSPGSRAQLLIAKAEDAIVRENYGGALPLLDSAIADAPANSPQMARAYYDRGYIEQEQQQASAAEADFRKANTADPKQFESHAALGRMLAEQKQWKEARHELELAAALQPASGDRARTLGDTDRMLAQVDAQLHDPAAAGDALLAALRLTPEQPDDTLLAARLAEQQNNYAGAEQEYRKALTAEPQSDAAAEGMARMLIHERKFADAEPVLQQALARAPNDPVLLAQSATALAGDGKTSQAVAQLETLHAQNPNQPAVTRMLADLYSTSGEPAKAAPLFQQLLASNGQDADLLTAAGENSLREQKWAEASDAFEKSLSLEPAQADAWSGLAFAASQDQQYALTLNALDHRAQYLPDGPATLFLRATALDHLHRTGEAVRYYQQFLAMAQGKFPDEESQTRQRLKELRSSH